MAPSLRDHLLKRVVRDGILHRSSSQAIVDVDGTSARWMLDSLGFSLTADGGALAGKVLLEKLKAFEGRQLATYGTIGIPLMQSVILASKGKYRGLLVRKEVKTYGARRRIEGQLDPREPVVMIDDSVSSGWSMMQCARHLHEAGLEIEGGLCLVRFGWDGVAKLERLTGRRVLSVFDLEADLAPLMPDEPRIPYNPTRVFPALQPSTRKGREGLSPCALARDAIAEWLTHHRVLRAPRRLEGKWEHRGGTWVSLRRRGNLHDRPARNGFWLFPDERGGTLGEDVVLAAVQTARDLEEKEKQPLKVLDDCAIAVTFFGPLRRCILGALDNDRYGIVVRSTERLDRIGGALPRMPGIRDGWGQFRHAAFNNARLEEDEPYALWRHDVFKAVEPGEAWQPTGVPRSASPAIWEEDARHARPLVEAARAYVLEAMGLEHAAAPALPVVPPDVRWVYLTAWSEGRLLGCTGCPVEGEISAVLRRLAVETAADPRFAKPGAPNRSSREQSRDAGSVKTGAEPNRSPREPSRDDASGQVGLRDSGVSPGVPRLLSGRTDRSSFLADPLGVTGPGPSRGCDVAVGLSFLRSPLNLGECDVEWAAQVTRFAQQALEVEQGNRKGLLLPLVGVLDNLSPQGFALAVLDKAGLSQPPYAWTRWDCTSWLDDGASTRRLDGALPAWAPFSGDLEAHRDALLPLLAGFLGRHHASAGPAVLSYLPFSDTQETGEANAWLAHRAWVKARLGWKAQAREDLKRVGLKQGADGRFWAGGDEAEQTVAEVAFALLAACELGEKTQARKLAVSLWASFDRFGFVKTHRAAGPNVAAQDYCPGQVLLALSRAVEARLTRPEPVLPLALAAYRRRFRGRPAWGAVGWLPQAYCAWARVLKQPEWRRFAAEIVDWALPSQSLVHGGFLNLEQSDAPGALTAVYLEGVAAVFQATGDSRYGAAMRRGLQFLDRLTYQQRDAAVLPNVEAAVGGLRTALTQSEVRLDFVQHALSALLNLDGKAR